jgi:hypothetical protein
MESVREILQAEGTSVEELEVNESYTYESDVFDNLAIEKVRDDIISVEQFYIQRMDRMSSPEVRFDVSDPENWEIVEYTDHSSYEETDYGKMQIHRTEDEIGQAEREFVETWDENLQNQYPAEEAVGGENQ